VLQIGIIGLGDIANKAYLPVVSKHKVEVHLFTRSEATLKEVSDVYRFTNLHQSLDSLIKSGIRGAFVHTPTDSHNEIVEELLQNNIHVYVDKPITYDYSTSARLLNLAHRKNLTLMVGFNRRYAPPYLKAKELPDPNMVVIQKNRNAQPGNIRTFIFDDFIHVVDTLLFFFPYSIEKMVVSGKKVGDLLYHVVVQFVAADGAMAIGIMNRDSGTTEEKVEVFSSTGKCVVDNIADVAIYQGKKVTKFGIDDWEPTLHRRGFDQITKAFLDVIQSGNDTRTIDTHTLQSHKICEEIVEQLSSSSSSSI
jgi:virulence factor